MQPGRPWALRNPKTIFTAIDDHLAQNRSLNSDDSTILERNTESLDLVALTEVMAGAQQTDISGNERRPTF